MPAPFTFVLPPELSAEEPPERRGIRRDQVRLLVIDRATGRIEHTRFDKIAEYLHKNGLLVFNSSRTLPASLRGCECGATHGPCMEVRLAERLPDDSWLALLLCEQGDPRSEEHTSELQSHLNLVCRLLLEKKKTVVWRATTMRS